MTLRFLILFVVCSLSANAFAQDDSLTVGKAVIRSVEHGSFVQYVPKSVKPNSKLLVVCHGMFSSGTAAESAKTCLKHWHKFAEDQKVIAVAPAFDNANYACTKPGAFGGYRNLIGRVVGEEDTKPLKKGMKKNHVTQATDWVNAMNDLATQNKLKGKVRLLVVKDVGHNYGKLSRAGAKSLKRALRTNR